MVSANSSSRSGHGAPIVIPYRVLNTCVRPYSALALVTRRVRITLADAPPTSRFALPGEPTSRLRSRSQRLTPRAATRVLFDR
jgi:hypothetical protein